MPIIKKVVYGLYSSKLKKWHMLIDQPAVYLNRATAEERLRLSRFKPREKWAIIKLREAD